MRQTVCARISALVFVLAIFCFSATVPAEGSVSFADGQYVKLGYTANTPLMWETKILNGAGGGDRILFLGSSVFTGGSYGDTNVWNSSNVKRYLNETYLAAHFPPDELATGVLIPYGNSPIFDVDVPEQDVAALSTRSAGEVIPPSSAEDSLIWIPDVQEIQAIYNGTPDIPWNDSAGYPQRLPFSAGGPYVTRSLDPNDPSVVWSIDLDGSFFKDDVDLQATVRPAVLPDSSVMLYKRGAGTQAEPYNVCYRWNVIPGVSARVGEKNITLSFAEPVANNGVWPGAEAWDITDSLGTKYSVTGTTGTQDKLTLSVDASFPESIENEILTLQYVQRFDDPGHGLNDTKGAILKAVNSQNPLLHFGLPGITLETSVDGKGEGNGDCTCDPNSGACLCDNEDRCKCDPNAGSCFCDTGNGCKCDPDAESCFCESKSGCKCKVHSTDACGCNNGGGCKVDVDVTVYPAKSKSGCNTLNLYPIAFLFAALYIARMKVQKSRIR